MQGYLGRAFQTPFLDLLAEFFNIERRRHSRQCCQPGFYWCDGDVVGNRVQTWLDAAYQPTGGASSANRRCPERDANRASTGVATKVRGFSGPVHPDTASQPAGGIPRMNRGTPRKNCTNRASTGVANDVRKMQPTGLLPVWSRSCSRRFVPGRVRRPRVTVTATTLPAKEILISIFLDDANWASTSVARTSERSGKRIHIGSPSASG